MGRKSEKGKERKLKRKIENALIAEQQKLVTDANLLKDPMATLLPFKKYERNGLKVLISCEIVNNIDKDTRNWIFDLTKDNMQHLYESSEWGWDDRKKREELLDEDHSWYLLARTEDHRPVAMTHFRFDLEDGDAVLYCYELQLVKDVRRKGLGRFMMQILELVAHKTGMAKVMLTVFKQNEEAQVFYREKLKYKVDETNLEMDAYDACHVDQLLDYLILSKEIKPRKEQNSTN